MDKPEPNPNSKVSVVREPSLPCVGVLLGAESGSWVRTCEVGKLVVRVRRLSASMTECGITSSSLAAVQLMKSDIPGVFRSEPFASHTIPQLMWWLLCRGIRVPTSWKKQQLISKLVIYISAVAQILQRIYGRSYLAPAWCCYRASSLLFQGRAS